MGVEIRVNGSNVGTRTGDVSLPVQLSGRSAVGAALLDAVTATGAGDAQAVTGDTLLITVTGAGAFAVEMEGSKDSGSTWYDLPVVRLDDGSYTISTSIATPGAYEVDISGWPSVRANCTATDGTALTVS